MNFLIVLVMASITVLTALSIGEIGTQKPADAGLLIGFGLAALLVLGFVTFQGMLRRSVVSDEYQYLMDYVRGQSTGSARIEDYQPPFGSKDIRRWTRMEEVMAVQ